MSDLRRRIPVALVLILASVSSSCGIFSGLFLRPRAILRNGKPATSKLMVATRDQLSERIASLYNPINSFQATVTMTPSQGSVYKGKIDEIADVPTLILFRKPADIRVLVRLPVAGTQVMDMVSNGTEFKMYLNSKNLFVEGLNAAPATSKNKMENLRPAAFLSSLMILPAEPGTEIPALTDLTDEDNALYVLNFIRKTGEGGLRIGRTVWFDRLDLSIVRQMVFDEEGSIISDTHYRAWTAYNGVLFPAHIDIQRPKEEYGVVMDVDAMAMNKVLTDQQFMLARPEGSTLQQIGGPAK